MLTALHFHIQERQFVLNIRMPIELYIKYCLARKQCNAPANILPNRPQ